MSSKRSAVNSQLIALDQTLIVFDLEQPRNASQTITVKKICGRRFVAFRLLVNAPTRYIVSPNSALLKEGNDIMKVQVQLVMNRYNPQHRLVIEAVAFDEEKRWPTIWNNIRSDDETQIMGLELSTTIVNIESAARLADENGPTKTLAQIMELSQTTGEERIKELNDVVTMLAADSETLEKNIEQTENLKKLLGEQISAKNAHVVETLEKIKVMEQEILKMREETQREKQEMAAQNERNRLPPNTQPCALM